jgi:hypothetical protein
MHSIYSNRLAISGTKEDVSAWLKENTDVTIGFPYIELDMSVSCHIPDDELWEDAIGACYRGTDDVLEIKDDGQTAVIYFETGDNIPLVYDHDADTIWVKRGWLKEVAAKYPHLSFGLNAHSYDDDYVIEMEWANGKLTSGSARCGASDTLTDDDKFILGFEDEDEDEDEGPTVIIEYPSIGRTYATNEYGVYEYSVHDENSVLAGEERRVFLDSFKTLDEAQAKYPNAEWHGEGEDVINES